MRGGERIDVLDGKGMVYHCTVDAGTLNRGRCILNIDGAEEASGEPSIKVTVCLPILKSGRFEWAIEKLTEVGVSKIVPIETQRSLVKHHEAGGNGSQPKLDRWRAIAREAAEQCERGLIPDVVLPTKLEKIIQDARDNKVHMLICAERSGAPALADLLAKGGVVLSEASLVVLIGPEGGFTESEIEQAINAGAKPITLGKRILRSETAAVYATSLLVGHLDK
jgi:16S rRNA (uracil1498-N3)-methyltransferase